MLSVHIWWKCAAILSILSFQLKFCLLFLTETRKWTESRPVCNRSDWSACCFHTVSWTLKVFCITLLTTKQNSSQDFLSMATEHRLSLSCYDLWGRTTVNIQREVQLFLSSQANQIYVDNSSVCTDKVTYHLHQLLQSSSQTLNPTQCHTRQSIFNLQLFSLEGISKRAHETLKEIRNFRCILMKVCTQSLSVKTALILIKLSL